MKILSAAQMQRIDRLTTERYSVPRLTLMENAGRGVVEFLRERFGPLASHKIAILCGRGNNGGDGMVVARLLREQGLDPAVVLLADPGQLKGDAAVEWGRVATYGNTAIAADLDAWRKLRPQLEKTTLIVDALIGTGLSRPLEGFALEIVRDINAGFYGAQVVAVDLPSGVCADTGELIGGCVRAGASVTFTAPKLAHIFPPACERVGEWVVKAIGTPPEALAEDPELFLNLISCEEFGWVAARRPLDAHKGQFGHVLIVAGSVGKTGAAALAAKAALRAGAGLVTVATAKSALPIIASLGMEFMTEPLPETDSGTISLRALDHGCMDKIVEDKTVLALGPGVSLVPETAEFVRAVANRYALPLVLDADGLNAFAGCMSTFRTGNRPAVLTPHPGEMARLIGKAAREIQKCRVNTSREFAMRYQATLVLKGFRTLVASPDGQVWVNPTGNAGMATGGIGDVLTGLVAGLWAQHRERPLAEVASAAVYLHGLAGDMAASRLGQASMLAGDLLEALPEAFRALGEKPAPSSEEEASSGS